MIDVKQFTDEELWLLTCGIEQLHDSMRHNKECFVEGIVEQVGDIRTALEFNTVRKLDPKLWEP